MTTSLNGGPNKELVPHSGHLSRSEPPPPPENFLLKFKNLTAGFDTQRDEFAALLAACKNQNEPVARYQDEIAPEKKNELDQSRVAANLAASAKNLLAELQALWPQEGPFRPASRLCIQMRLGLMLERLPRSEPTKDTLTDEIEAELPSAMAFESTCRELETTTTKFPMPVDILPVLRKQMKAWAARMAAVDVPRIEQIGNEWHMARVEQYAIFERNVRKRLALAGHEDLLTILDEGGYMPDLVRYVSVIEGLRRGNCNELAEKLHGFVEMVQSDDDGSAQSELERLYPEALRLAETKRYERACAERAQEREQDSRDRREQERCEKENQRVEIERQQVEEEWWREQLLEEQNLDRLRRLERDNWKAIASERDPWLDISADTYAEIKKNGIPSVTTKELAARVAQQKRDLTIRELRDLMREQRKELRELREGAWDQAISMLPELLERLNDVEEKVRRLSYSQEQRDDDDI